jgi:hypothetical protein
MNAPTSPPARKIVQLAACGDAAVTELYALADDGSVWRSSFHTGQGWVRINTSIIESGAT